MIQFRQDETELKRSTRKIKSQTKSFCVASWVRMLARCRNIFVFSYALLAKAAASHSYTFGAHITFVFFVFCFFGSFTANNTKSIEKYLHVRKTTEHHRPDQMVMQSSRNFIYSHFVCFVIKNNNQFLFAYFLPQLFRDWFFLFSSFSFGKMQMSMKSNYDFIKNPISKNSTSTRFRRQEQ